MDQGVVVGEDLELIAQEVMAKSKAPYSRKSREECVNWALFQTCKDVNTEE